MINSPVHSNTEESAKRLQFKNNTRIFSALKSAEK